MSKIGRRSDPVTTALKTIKGRIKELRYIVKFWARSEVTEIVEELSQDVKRLENLLEREKDDGK